MNDDIEPIPCKHFILDANRFPHLKLVNLILPVPNKPILAWKRKERGADGSYYCQFCDKGNRRMTQAGLCYGYRDCYEVDE